MTNAYWFDTSPKTYFSRAVQCKILLFKILNNVYTCRQKYNKEDGGYDSANAHSIQSWNINFEFIFSQSNPFKYIIY